MGKKIIPLALIIFFANIPLMNANDLTLIPPVSAVPHTQQIISTSVQSQTPVQAPTDSPADLDPALRQAVDSSQQAAEAWLKIVDQGSYGNSWDAGALPLRLVMSRKEWMLSLDTMRKPLGRPVQRKVEDIRLAQDPKGLARGNYMIFIYDTSFANGHQAQEILTLQQSNDGQWRVLTYLVSVVK